MKITLVRHAEVRESYLGKYNGHIDIPLSNNGKLQAIKLAKELENENFDAIYCSDLLRAKETLKAFKLDVTPIFTSRLREKSWGIHEGKSFQEIVDSGIEYKNFQQWIGSLDGESIEIYTKNVKNYFQNILLQGNAKNVLIVTHSGFIKTLHSLRYECSLEKAFAIKLPYASYIKFSYNSS